MVVAGQTAGTEATISELMSSFVFISKIARMLYNAVKARKTQTPRVFETLGVWGAASSLHLPIWRF